MSLPRPRVESLDDRITPTVAFGSTQLVDLTGGVPASTVIADLNGDGRADLATANTNASTVSLVVSTGTGTFTTISMPVASGPGSIATGDINGDGRADLITANAGANSISILLNDTPHGAVSPTFLAQQLFTVGAAPSSVAVADLNGDRREDIAIVAGGQLQVLLNTTAAGAAAATFADAQIIANAAAEGTVAVADFNNDGRLDLVASDSTVSSAATTSTVRVYTNGTAAGAETLSTQAATVLTSTTSTVPFKVSTGDFNSDGRIDFAVTDGTNFANVLLNTTEPWTATPTFADKQTFDLGSTARGAAVAADVSGDGRADLAVATNSGIAVLTNTTKRLDPTASMTSAVLLPAGTNPQALVAGDLDRDGRVDLAVGGAAGLNVLANTGAAGSTGPVVIGQFGQDGVWRLDRISGNWTRLTDANATVLASSANGNIVASFRGNGVWYYTPSNGWAQINRHEANAVAIDAAGNVAASFVGFGTATYRVVGGWSAVLTTEPADLLAVNASGELVAHYKGYGMWSYTVANGWKQLTDNRAATSMGVADNGDVVASFRGFGVWRYTTAGGWRQINTIDATNLAVGANGEVVASFRGFGVAKYVTAANWWKPLHSGLQATSVAMDLYGNVFASFSNYGVYEHNVALGWQQRTRGNTGTLAAAA